MRGPGKETVRFSQAPACISWERSSGPGFFLVVARSLPLDHTRHQPHLLCRLAKA